MSRPHILNPSEYERCNKCFGEGRIMCPDCGYQKYIYRPDGSSYGCSRCLAKGDLECRLCGGTGSTKIPEYRKPIKPREKTIPFEYTISTPSPSNQPKEHMPLEDKLRELKNDLDRMERLDNLNKRRREEEKRRTEEEEKKAREQDFEPIRILILVLVSVVAWIFKQLFKNSRNK